MSTSGQETPRATRAKATASDDITKDVVKIGLPSKFDGNHKEVSMFIMKCRIYFGFHQKEIVTSIDKTVWATTFFEGRAFDWIEPYLTDVMSHRTPDGALTTAARPDTIQLMNSWENFASKLQQYFGDHDRKRTAERNLRALVQKGSAAKYTAEFQQWSSMICWNNESLASAYYNGLKENIKDEICRGGRPTTLEDMIDEAISIDNRFYERALEKKGQPSRGFVSSNQRQTREIRTYDPMELDATDRRQLSPEEFQKRRENRLCFECGKPGHTAQMHRSGRAREAGRVPRPGRRDGFRQEYPARQLHATNRNSGYHRMDRQELCVIDRPRRKRGRREHPNPLENDRQPLESDCDVIDGSDCENEESSTSSGTLEEVEEDLPVVRQQSWEERWKAENNAGNIKHPLHCLYQYTVCPYNECNVHYAAKVYSYFPERGMICPLYPGFDGSDYGEPKEGIERIYLDDWEEIDLTQAGRVTCKKLGVFVTWQKALSELCARDDTKEYAFIAEGAEIFAVKTKGIVAIGGKGIIRPKMLQEQLCATNMDTRQIVEEVQIYGLKLRAMIDSGATGNFISRETALRKSLPIQRKRKPYQLYVVSGEKISEDDGWVLFETKPMVLTMLQGHQEKIQLDLVVMESHQIILGMPWLQRHNPQIDWVHRKIIMTGTGLYGDRIMRGVPPNPVEVCATSREDDEHLAQGSLQRRIPAEYGEYQRIFEERPPELALPAHQTWDHEIPLEEGTKPSFGPIYSLSEKELKVLKEYIEENLARGFIR